jgi:hypothetical protein
MPDQFDPQTLSQDKSFLAMPVPKQMEYLAYASPDYKGFSPDQRLAYLNHLTGKQAPTTENNPVENASAKEGGWKEFGKGVLKAPLAPVATTAGLLNKIPYVGETLSPSQGVNALTQIATPQNKSQEIGAKSAQAAATLIPMGLGVGEAAAAGGGLAPVMRTIGQKVVMPAVKSAIGAAGGGIVGREVGNLVGAPKVGEQIGGLAGGIYGGYKGFKGEPVEIPRLKTMLGDFAQSAEKTPTMSPPTVPETIAPTPTPMGAPPVPTAPATIGPLEAPQPKASMSKLGDLIEHEGAGAPRLQPNVPIGQQRFAGPPTFRQPPLIENPDVRGGVITAPEKMPTIPREEIGNQMGAPPLKPNVPLRGQFKPMEAAGETPPSKQASLEAKYPDKAVRQLAHANGEEIVDATENDPETRKAIHDLTNPDVRQALINSGEDMGQQMVNNRKASGDMSRQDAFRKLLGKGVSPKEILRLAKQPLEREKTNE